MDCKDICRVIRGKKAALFDMDGTLIDSIGVWNETDRRLHVELTGREPDMAALQAFRDDALRRFRGEENPYLRYGAELKERYHAALTAKEIYERRYAIAHALLERVDYKPGADELLWALKSAGLRLILVTTTRRRTIETYRTRNENIMKKAPLDALFERIYTCEDAKNIKPDPEIYFTLFRDTGLVPKDCVVFEDSLTGVRAAKAAGLFTVAVYDRYSDADRAEITALADGYIDGFPALVEALTEKEEKKHEEI